MNINQTCDKGGVAPWSDLNHDLLNSVMMRLGVVDFLAFNRVCKSWRSLAVPNRNSFMASKPPMVMSISTDANEKECYCYLRDFEGRRFKTILPHSAGRTCVGLTCGYLILFGDETHDFWLVNPITRHELHFSDVPFDVSSSPRGVIAILVFRPSISGWVFIVVDNINDKIWFCIAGKRAWNYVSSTSFILDLHVLNGKIYTLHRELDDGQICEFSIAPKPKLAKLQTKIFPNNSFHGFVKWGGNLYPRRFKERSKVDCGEMKWVRHLNKKNTFGYFYRSVQHIGVVLRDSSADPISKCRTYDGWLNYLNIWYFPHDCVNVNVLDE